MSDNTRTRQGRRLPYLLYSTVPLAVFFIMLFSIPRALHGWILFFYATLCSMLLRFALSLFNLPYYAVGAEVTDDYAERTSIVSYRVCVQTVGTFCAIALGLGVFMSGPNGVLNRLAYMPFAWTCAVLMLIAGYISARAVRTELARLHIGQKTQGGLVSQFIRELREVFRNRSFIIIFLTTAAFFIGYGASGALALYANRYFWNLPTPIIQLLLLGAALGPFIGAPVYAKLAPHFEKRRLTIVSLLIFSMCLLCPPLLRNAHWLPDSGTALIGILFAISLLGGVAIIGAAIGLQSMMADATDEHEYLFGVRREGLFFSGISLAAKTASGIGGFISGVALDLIHFPAEIAKTDPSFQLPHTVVRAMGFVSGPVPAAIIFLAPIILFAYSLSKAKHAAILVELDQRKNERP